MKSEAGWRRGQTDSGNDEDIVENRRKSQKIAEKLGKNARDNNHSLSVA
jgi:hypothetical protein